MSRLVARVLMGTSLAVVVLGLLALDQLAPPGRVPWVSASLLSALCAWELARMGSFREKQLGLPLFAASIGATVHALFSPRGAPWETYLVALAAALLACALLGLRSGPASWAALPLAAWMVPPLYGLIPIGLETGTAGLVVLVVLSKIGDSAGYFVGRSIGKRHPFPTISPGKTVAGCVASLAAGVVAGACLVPLLQGTWGIRPVLLGLAVGLAINVAAQLGDLAKSWVKRRAGVKDSSRLLGPSGGVLDVVDSLLLTTPLAVLIWPRLF
jgi:phosphatidate cytidylyltransferase